MVGYESPQANFANVPPGRYELRVRGSNNDGLWNDMTPPLELIVTPPFWKTWVFWVLILPLLILAGVTVNKIRNKMKQRVIADHLGLDGFNAKHKITKREGEIILFILQGKSNEEIMKELYISINTVKTHISNIFKKTNVRSRGKLINKIRKHSE